MCDEYLRWTKLFYYDSYQYSLYSLPGFFFRPNYSRKNSFHVIYSGFKSKQGQFRPAFKQSGETLCIVRLTSNYRRFDGLFAVQMTLRHIIIIITFKVSWFVSLIRITCPWNLYPSLYPTFVYLIQCIYILSLVTWSMGRITSCSCARKDRIARVEDERIPVFPSAATRRDPTHQIK